MTRLIEWLIIRSIDHRRVCTAAWLIATVGAIGTAVWLGGESNNEVDLPTADSQRAAEMIEERLPAIGASSALMVFEAPAGRSLFDADARKQMELAVKVAGELPAVDSVIPPAAPSGTITPDGRVGIAQVLYSTPASRVPTTAIEQLLALETPGGPGLRIEIGGEVPGTMPIEGGATSEMIGIVAALALLTIAYRSSAAAVVPVAAGAIGTAFTLAGISVVSRLARIPTTASTLAAMLGLAVGVDYALFLVARYKEQAAEQNRPLRSAIEASRTTGGAIVFAGASVVFAILGLTVVKIPMLVTMGLAAAAGVVVAVTVALTLVPGWLVFGSELLLPRARRNIRPTDTDAETLRPADHRGGLAAPRRPPRWAVIATRRPLVTIVLVTSLLGTLAVPALSIVLAIPDDSSLPVGNTRRDAYDLVGDSFGRGVSAPIVIVADIGDTPPERVRAGLDDLAGQARVLEGVATVADPEVFPNAQLALISVIPREGAAHKLTRIAVDAIRVLASQHASSMKVSFLVTGAAAANSDISDALADATVPFLAVVLAPTFILLLIAFRSMWIAAQAVVAMLLSVIASFGVVVAAFQWGWLTNAIGLDRSLPVVSYLPLFMFAILFGLSMDYEVFIITRISEARSEGRTARLAVLDGITASAPTITLAAAIMVAVFSSFVLQGDPTVKMFGVGLSVAVLLDATIGRWDRSPPSTQY